MKWGEFSETLCVFPVVVFEGLGASAPPSGNVRQDTYEELRDEILAQCAAAMPLDGVVLGLHGAMVANGYDDVEGDLLSRVRAIVGPGCPIGAELDPHSHLTDLRFESADILIAFKVLFIRIHTRNDGFYTQNDGFHTKVG